MCHFKVIIFLSILIFISFFSYLNAENFIIEDFDQNESGIFPSEWKARKTLGKKLYIVTEDKKTKNRFLTVTDRGESIQIGKEISWDIKKYPVLSWSWRVKELPANAAENNGETNDSAAGIYVIFDKVWFVIPRTIKYVWSSTLPVGTVIEKGYTRIVVVKSGPQDLNKWINLKVNIYEDFKRFFNKEPSDPKGIAILTDANATQSIAVADYDNFKALMPKSLRMIAGEK